MESVYEIYGTLDQSQWVLDLYYSRPESTGSGTIIQWTRVNGFWHHITDDQSPWILEL